MNDIVPTSVNIVDSDEDSLSTDEDEPWDATEDSSGRMFKVRKK